MMDKEFVVPVAEGHTMTLDAVVMPPLNNPSRVRLSLGTQLLKREQRGEKMSTLQPVYAYHTFQLTTHGATNALGVVQSRGPRL